MTLPSSEACFYTFGIGVAVTISFESLAHIDKNVESFLHRNKEFT